MTVLAGLVAGGCAGNGCGGCALEPLPGGALPSDQTLEGGAQIRVTPQGFDRLTDVAGAVINDALGDGLCMPRGGIGIGIGDITYCPLNDGSCTPGCDADIHVDSLSFTPNQNSVRLRTQFDIQVDLPVQFDPFFGGTIGPCTLNVTANDNVVDADVNLGIRASDGELQLSLGTISNLTLHPSISGCSFVGAVINAVANVVSSILGVDVIANLLRPALNSLVQGFLPDPLGFEGALDVAGLVAPPNPVLPAKLETRIVPGGYAVMEGGGLSLGVITGFNADRDPTTRTAELDSQPSICVPPFAAPDFTTVPLPIGSRRTFNLLPADLFRGSPEPSGDLAIGVSSTFLDQIGHHLVASGALCLGIGTERIAQLTVGTLGLLVPSLSELGGPTGTDPLLLVTRPQQAISFSIGDGSESSPALTVHLQNFEIDFYAFLFERYTRAFTMSLDLNVGVNLDFTTDDSGAPAILPMLTGLGSQNVHVDVLNSEFLREDRATLESVLPSLLDVVVQLLDDSLGPIALPEFAGFRLANLTTQKVSTSQDDFLAITADLGAGTLMAALAARSPSIAAQLQTEHLAPPPVAAHQPPRLISVDVPKPDQAALALLGRGGRLPSVTIDTATHDTVGRLLEWTYSIGGGLWKPFQPGGRLTLRERAFAVQGKYDLRFAARVVGDYRTLDRQASAVAVVIDSVGPRVMTDRIAVQGDGLVVPAVDLVSPAAEVAVAIGPVGSDRPTTGWTTGTIGTIALADARAAASGSGGVTVFAKDAVGNQTVVELEVAALRDGDNTSSGGCGVGGRGGAASAIVALMAAVLLRRRRPTLVHLGRAALVVGGIVVAGLMPACSCGNNAAGSCDLVADCDGFCDDGQIASCVDGQCLCQDNLTYGSIGAFSEVATDDKGLIYVSAYNRTHGDLMIAAVDHDGRIADDEWSFVDGVPEGPVVVAGSTIRGGILAPGDDVGLYTDVVVSAEVAMVSYFDATHGALKYADNVGGSFVAHAVAGGIVGPDGESERVGQYSSITVDLDGKPGIAFLAQLVDPDGAQVSELRFAQAATPHPRSAADWTVYVADRVEVPMSTTPDALTIPEGTGLFASAARLSDGRPVIAYYDRVAGDLELVTFDPAGGGFLAPEVLDGADGADVGWYPSLHIDGSDQGHVTYVSASRDDLLYVNTVDRTPEVIDDGYRLVGQTADGLPKPEFHLVGDDSALQFTAVGPYVAYQDATSHELLAANKGSDGFWHHLVLAGIDDPFAGGYGFFTSATMDSDSLIVSNWVIDQPNSDSWVEIIRAIPTPIE